MTMLNNKMCRYAFVGGVLLAAAGLVAPAAEAQQSGGVRVKGNTELNVTTENVNTIASGTGNVARTTIGGVKGNTQQNTKVTVDVKNVSNVASGRNKKACVNIGVVGADPNCK